MMKAMILTLNKSLLACDDPDFEQVIIGLLDREKLFCNPFQLSRHVQEMLAAQASQAAARAITWSMVDFERVGGNGTLRTVWNALKDENRVKGLKRPHSEGDAEENKEEKRMCCSLDLSGTCHRLQLIDIVSEGSSCSVERDGSGSESELDISRLLEETRDRGDVSVMLEDARALVDEVLQEIPDLTSSEGSWEEFSDSGNSEVEWGWSGRDLVTGDLVAGAGGDEAPVTVGNSSLSDSEEEVLRIRRLMRELPSL